MGNVLVEGIEIMTSGIVPYATALGAGLKELTTSLFIEAGTDGTQKLALFGGVVFLFAGISLAVGLSRWGLNFFTSLGARNR